jgi:hypothetical protein
MTVLSNADSTGNLVLPRMRLDPALPVFGWLQNRRCGGEEDFANFLVQILIDPLAIGTALGLASKSYPQAEGNVIDVIDRVTRIWGRASSLIKKENSCPNRGCRWVITRKPVCDNTNVGV